MTTLLLPFLAISVLFHLSTASLSNPHVNNREFGNQAYDRADNMNGGMGEENMRKHFDFENNDHLDIGWIVVKHRDIDPSDGNNGNPMKWGRNNWNNNNQYPMSKNGMYGYPYRSMGTYNNQYPGRSHGIFNNQYPEMFNNQYPERSYENNQYPGSDDWMNEYPKRFSGTNNNQYPGRSQGIFNNQYPESANGMFRDQYPNKSYGNNQYPENFGYPNYPTNSDNTFQSNGIGTPFGNSQNAHNPHPTSGSLSNNRAKRDIAIGDNSKDSIEKSVENSSESPEDMTV